MSMKSVVSLLPFWRDVFQIGKINVGDLLFSEFPSKCYSVFLLFISLISPFHLFNNSNPRASTLKHANFVKAGPWQYWIGICWQQKILKGRLFSLLMWRSRNVAKYSKINSWTNKMQSENISGIIWSKHVLKMPSV